MVVPLYYSSHFFPVSMVGINLIGEKTMTRVVLFIVLEIETKRNVICGGN